MPVITVEMWEGRTIDQKRTLTEGITEAFSKIGTTPDKVTIIFRESAKRNWAQGGKLASDTP